MFSKIVHYYNPQVPTYASHRGLAFCSSLQSPFSFFLLSLRTRSYYSVPLSLTHFPPLPPFSLLVSAWWTSNRGPPKSCVSCLAELSERKDRQPPSTSLQTPQSRAPTKSVPRFALFHTEEKEKKKPAIPFSLPETVHQNRKTILCQVFHATRAGVVSETWLRDI